MNSLFFLRTRFFGGKLFHSLVFLLIFFLFPFFAFAANEDRVTVIDGPFSLSGAWGGALNVGGSAETRTISVQHEVGTTEGSLIVIPGDALNFSYTPADPRAVLDKGIFNRNELVGRWANSLSGRNDCSADPSAFTIGADQYAFVLCGTKPAFSLFSNNNSAMSCAGMVCTANGVGSARITATLVGTPAKIWGQKNADGWIDLVSTTLPGATLSWDVSVVMPPTLTFASSGTNPIPYNTGVTLSWSAGSVVSSNPCVASGDWSGAKAASGTFPTGNLTARRDYTLRCTGPSGDTVDGTVTVLVGSPTPAPRFTFTADTTTVPSGSETTLRWNVLNPAETTNCEASGEWSGTKAFSGWERTGSLFVDPAIYILTCFGPGGSQAKQITVRIIPPPEPPDFRYFSADPDHILYNDSTELSWDVQNATSCTMSNDQGNASWNGALSNFSSSRTISNLTRETVFTLRCTGPGGTEDESVTVRVEPQNLQPPSIVSFSADDNSLDYNEGTTLRWRVDRADWCEASGDWDWWTDTYFDDWYDTGNLVVSKSYTLHCENLAGSIEQTVVVSVDDPLLPVVIDYFTADPYAVDYGGSTRARWSVQNAQWCYLDWWQAGVYQSRINNFSFTGDEVWGNLTQSETDVLTCGNSLGTAPSASITITVNPGSPGPDPDPDPDPDPLPDPPIISFTRDSGFVSYNTATTLRWNVLNADACESWNNQGLSSWDGPVSLAGTATTGNLRAETYFYLGCNGPGGYSELNVQVRVGSATEPGPTLSFWADRISLSTGESTNLYWQSANATSCTASGDWSGNKVLSNYPGNPSGSTGGFATGALSGNKTYRLRCSNPASGAVVVTVNVFVGTIRFIPNPSLSFYADDLSVPIGGSTFLRWNAQNVRTCTASAISDPVASPFPTSWSGDVPLSGGRTTGNLPEGRYEYTMTCTNGLFGSDERVVSLKTRVYSGVFVALGPEVTLYAEARLIEAGTSPILYYEGNYADRCFFSINGGPETLLPSLSGILNDPLLLPPISGTTTYSLRCSDVGGTVSTANAIVKVGTLFLCPDSIPVILPGDTLQFHAWWYEGAAVATCGTVSALGGVDVTKKILGTELWETEWSADGTVLNLDGSAAGLVRGAGSGVGTVSVRHRPEGSTLRFVQSSNVQVARPVDCWRCNDSTSRCSGETQWDAVNDPPRCSSDTFSSSTSCRFSCFKKRWEEVAP